MEVSGRNGTLPSMPMASNSGLNDGSHKLPGGSGPGSSEDSLAGEVGRLAEENARYRQKLADLMGKSTAGPPPKAASSSHLIGSAERMQDQLRRLKRENNRLLEQNAALERRVSSTRNSPSADHLWRYKEECRGLRAKNAELTREKEKFDRTAEYVCQKVLKIIGTARREGNFNSQLVGELKRWNEKLEDENHRLYNIIDRMQSKGNDVQDAVAEATVLSKNHDKDRDGNAAIVKELETQNVKIQEEMSKLSDQAMTLQNLSSSSSGSSGPLPPRTPSNSEMDGSASRRSRSPAGALRGRRPASGGELRRKNRAMSMESVGSETKDFEFLKMNNKKYTEDIERIGADLAFVREQVSAKAFSMKEKDVGKLTEASERLTSLEHTNSVQAEEIERLMSSQTELKVQAQAYDALKEEFGELEDDCLKLATEVERLQPIALRVHECETQVEEYRQKIAELEHGAATASSEVGGIKTDQVEMQRTLSAMAADKAVLQAELRELLEERTQLQGDLNDLEAQVQELQTRANSAAYLESELEVAKEENLAYSKEIQNLQLEREQLKAEIRDLEQKDGANALRESLELAREDPRDAELAQRNAELAQLRAENEDLTAKSYNNVILNVELTTLRNQVKDLQGAEAMFQEQISKLKQGRLALQKEADTIPALKAEIAELQLKLQAAESQHKRQEAELVSQRSSPQPTELVKEHEDRGRKVRELKEENVRLEAELGRSETRLRSLQAKYESLLRDHTQRSQQAAREQEDAESRSSVLTLALKQERGKTNNLGKEAAELHALLQTAHNERQDIQAHLAELRNENAKLVQRVTQLDTKNDELESTLEAVFSSQGMSNGHATQQVREEPFRVSGAYNNAESRASPFEPAASTKGGSGKVKGQNSHDQNGKSEKNGFSFFKKKSRSNDAVAAEGKRQRSPSPAPAPAPTVEASNGQNPDQEVMAAYDQYVDTDDIDGFMTALGYKGFKSPTSPDDMKGAFASAKYVVRPEALANLSEYSRLKGEATHELLEAWHSAWVESLSERGISSEELKSMRSF